MPEAAMTSLTVDSAETAWGMFLNPIFVRQQATQSVDSDLAFAVNLRYPLTLSAPALALCGQHPHELEKRSSLAYASGGFVSL